MFTPDASIDSSHRHSAKRCTPGAAVGTDGRWLKWYDIHSPGAPIPDTVQAAAREAIATNPSGLGSGEAGFVILHRCGESFYFLLVQTWRHGNELWETVLYKTAEMTEFAPFAAPGSHRPTFCVWEMGAVWHETEAWKRFLTSERSAKDVQVWMDDALEGDV